MTIDIQFKNGKNHIVENIEKILEFNKTIGGKIEISDFTSFIVKRGHYYTFVGNTTFSIESDEIFSVEFTK